MKEINTIGLWGFALLSLLFAGCAGTPASAPTAAPQQATFSFSLMNDTWIEDFQAVHIAPPDSTDWGPNLIDAPLGAGGKARLNVSKSFEGALVNLLIYTEDGSRRMVYGLKLVPESVITVDENDLAEF